MQITPSAQSNSCITLNDVSFFYKAGEPALEHITFSVNHGDYLGILGPNGGGKTTLLKIILGLLTPQSGVVRIDNTLPSARASHLHIGYVPQKSDEEQWNFPATVEEVVLMGRTVRAGVLKKYAPVDFEAVERAMETTGITAYRAQTIATLSGGLRQRILIARALASNPTILILDEPATGVDIAAQEQFYSFLKMLNTKHGLTILFVSHDLDVLARETTSVLCVNRTLISHGPTSEALREEHLEELYGKKVAFAVHRH
ncbi:MAG: Polyamine-transporting ATPase [Candidatus Magasanikbacteria bacterium GW2011_GWC2_45_8]|uniref:Polyamine-transporting ATPase n=1 Tax=Candidatus Magasanikbacteria bacterium GW2011_GWC2_45_8 TaxID=1619050 RepID=A0A0G1R016_9BACT|nr:MAG: Polyamine-transporting ATPase [Candidatus Magasanikbacteria bacterium GW2011_GWC2_45_8]HBW73767.1 zinc ABC transporter ATP-binding protein [Candidatus Magasanikbacteria bacterium]